MTTIKKIAILKAADDDLSFEIDEVRRSFQRHDIATKVFYESDSIAEYAPDCVLVTSPQEGKLTEFPTYGLLNQPRDSYLELPRFTRNILSYDGYLTFSPRLAEMLRDITFGARKLDTNILEADFFPAATTFREPDLKNAHERIAIFDADFGFSRFKQATFLLLKKFKNCKVITFSINTIEEYRDRFVVVSSLEELDEVLKQYSVAICLNGGDKQESTISPAVIKLISACVSTISHHTPQLEKYFGDSIYYLNPDLTLKSLPGAISGYIDDIRHHHESAVGKVTAAHQVFLTSFAFDNFISKFADIHASALINRGYLPQLSHVQGGSQPSITYILHASGKSPNHLKRFFHSLLKQGYPDLRVIVITHADPAFVEELPHQFRTLITRVIAKPSSSYSDLKREALKAVETDLFGMADESMEFFPNHIRQLIKTMHYHTGRDWRGDIGVVYSGSVSANEGHPAAELREYQDHKLGGKNDRRVIGQFQFYSSKMIAQHAWAMTGGWLAKSSLLNDEILVDPEFDHTDDIYLLLQMAQKTHFAFSVEVTMAHHARNNSHINMYDTQRIALLNLSRTYAQDALYDTTYNIVGRISNHDDNQIFYQDVVYRLPRGEYWNPFYPFRFKQSEGQSRVEEITYGATGFMDSKIAKILLSPLFLLKFILRFLSMESNTRGQYLSKLSVSLKREGFSKTLLKLSRFIFRVPSSG